MFAPTCRHCRRPARGALTGSTLVGYSKKKFVRVALTRQVQVALFMDGKLDDGAFRHLSSAPLATTCPCIMNERANLRGVEEHAQQKPPAGVRLKPLLSDLPE
jgi:hypothetical protein